MANRKADSAESTARDDPAHVTTYRTRTRMAKEQYRLDISRITIATETMKVADETQDTVISAC